MRIVICIPTYNEAENIGGLIDTIMSLSINPTVVIVDDNSEDGTRNEVQGRIKKFGIEKVKLLTRTKKDGRGGAVWYGFRKMLALNFDIFVEMDADFSHDPHELINGIKMIDRTSSLIIGARYPHGKILGWPIKRRVLSRLANILARILISNSIFDFTNGYRLYTAETVKIIEAVGLRNKGFICLSETIAICIVNNCKIESFPITFRDRSKGDTSATFLEVMRSLVAIFDIAIGLRNGRYIFHKRYDR